MKTENITNINLPKNLKGLSTLEVKNRIENNQVNTKGKNILKSFWKIIFDNTFTWFNFITLFLGILVILAGSSKNALFLGTTFLVTSVGIIKEIRAKKTVEKLSLISELDVKVIRDEKIIKIKQAEIVMDDFIYLNSGDQISVDGILLYAQGLELNESSLTGEADAISKTEGDWLFSGSYVTTGVGVYKVTTIGSNNYASKIIYDAQKKTKLGSKLLKNIENIIKHLTFIMIPIGALLFIVQLKISKQGTSEAIIRAVGALIGMIPSGLVLLTSIAFAVGAAKLASKKVLVQTLSAIEALARVDIICLDKTGTITDGTLTVENVVTNKENSLETVNKVMSELLSILPDENATALALRRKFSHKLNPNWKSKLVIPFSSSRKWSGVVFENSSYVIGAAEFIFKEFPSNLKKEFTPYLEAGKRVLVLVSSDSVTPSSIQNPRLLAYFVLEERLRENAIETFHYLKQQGVTLKVISGDHPISVSTVAKKANIMNAEKYIDMSQVSEQSNYRELVESYTIFGRVSPYQKRKLIYALNENGHITGMTGDGVNDVLALREAGIGIAMANGSDAARMAADIVLLNSNFSDMVPIIYEGRKVVNNIERVASMYLVKTIYSIALALIFIILARPYPLKPLHLMPINAFTVGIPSFFLALRSNKERIKGNFIENVLKISLPAAVCAIITVSSAQLMEFYFKWNSEVTSTFSAMLLGVVSSIVLFQVSKPFTIPRTILFALMVLFLSVSFLDPNNFFSYGVVLGNLDYLYIFPFIILSWFIIKISLFLITTFFSHRNQKWNL